jgi:hypothetical protein
MNKDISAQRKISKYDSHPLENSKITAKKRNQNIVNGAFFSGQHLSQRLRPSCPQRRSAARQLRSAWQRIFRAAARSARE